MKKQMGKKGLLPSGTQNNKTSEAKPKFGNTIYNIIYLAFIIGLGSLIYSNSFNCSFHFDDLSNIVKNPKIQNLTNVTEWWNYNPNRPMAFLTFALNYHFNQQDVRYWHLVNLVIHLMNACLVYWLTKLIFSSQILNQSPILQYKNIIVFFTAILFVSHPLATGSVTYIVQRMTSLVTMFYLISILLYIKARLVDNNDVLKLQLFSGSFVSGLFAMLTKENAYTLPFSILLVEIFILDSKWVSFNYRDKRIKLIALVLLSFMVLLSLKFSTSIFKTLPPSLYNSFTITPLNYFLTQSSVIIKYIQLLFVPINLNLDYDYQISNSIFEVRTLLSFLLIVALMGFAKYLFKENRVISFCIFWFFLTLSIESSFIPISDLIFEHRTYLPSFGFFLGITSGLFIVFGQNYKYVAMTILIGIVITNSVQTYKRNLVWRNDFTLWNDVVFKSPNKARPYYNRGIALDRQGQLDKAIADYSKAIQINQNYTSAYSNRGLAYIRLKQFDRALADSRKAIEIDPKCATAFNNLGLIFDQQGQLNESVSQYSKAIELNPNYEEAYSNRGISYGKLEAWEKSIADFSKAIELDPTFKAAYANRELAYSKLRNGKGQ
jgi:tetratricopeptide (TPR) repeat protein